MPGTVTKIPPEWYFGGAARTLSGIQQQQYQREVNREQLAQRDRFAAADREDRYNFAQYAAENQQYTQGRSIEAQQYGQERGIQAQYDLTGLREQAQFEQQQLAHQQRMEADAARQEKQLELEGQEWRYSDDDQRAIDKIESRKSRIRREGLDPADEESAIARADQEIAKFQKGPNKKRTPHGPGIMQGGTYSGDRFPELNLSSDDSYFVGQDWEPKLVDTGKTQQQSHEAKMAKVEADHEKNVSTTLEKRRESAKDEGVDRWEEALDTWEYEKDIDRDEGPQAAWLKNNQRPRRSDFLEASFKEEFSEEIAANEADERLRQIAETDDVSIDQFGFVSEEQQFKDSVDEALGELPLTKAIRGSRENPVTPTTQAELESIKKNGGYVRNSNTGEILYYPPPNTKKTDTVSKIRRRQKIEPPVVQIPKV